MAVKTVAISDISGTELDDQHARVIVEHPDFNFPLELDVTDEEADKFAGTTLRFATIRVIPPKGSPRTVQVETKVLDKLFSGVDFNAVLEGARRADGAKSAGGGRQSGSRGRADRVDYTLMENIGLIHRGRVTEEEARLVRENMAQANKNRAREGQPKVGDDPKDEARYGLK